MVDGWSRAWGIVRLIWVVGQGREARSRDARESFFSKKMHILPSILPSLLSLS